MYRPLILLAAMNLLAAGAQPAGGISGSITETAASGGNPSKPAGVTVRAKNTATGATSETRTAANGTYKLPLVPGTYDVFMTLVGHPPFIKRKIAVASAWVPIDAHLVAGLNEGTPGELAYLHFRDEHTAPKGPAPRTSDGRPNLSGVWYPGLDLEPEEVPFLPWAAEYARTHGVAEDPRAYCLPSGVARGQQMELTKIIQTPAEIVILFEGSPPGFRQIFLDGRSHPKELEPTWMGHSIGHWESNTLIVDTVGFNNRAWIDFNHTPQTEQLHITERYRRTDLGHLDLVITIDDPGAYSRPWKLHRILALAPKTEEIQEYICNENNSTQHLVR